MGSERDNAYDQVPVTPSDSEELSSVSDGLSLNVGGTVVMKLASGRTVTRVLVGGVDYAYQVKQVLATGTDSDLGIHALYFGTEVR